MEIRMDSLRYELLTSRAADAAFKGCPANPGSWKEWAYVGDQDLGLGSLPLVLCINVTLRRAMPKSFFGGPKYPSERVATRIFDIIGMTTGLHEGASAQYDALTSLDVQDGVGIQAIVTGRDDVAELAFTFSKMVPVPDDDKWFDEKLATHAGLVVTGKKVVETAEQFAARGVRALEIAYGKVWP